MSRALDLAGLTRCQRLDLAAALAAGAASLAAHQPKRRGRPPKLPDCTKETPQLAALRYAQNLAELSRLLSD